MCIPTAYRKPPDPDASPQQTLENMLNAVDGFVKTAEQFDDLTMLCFEYKGPAA